jgi:putative flippase GtrA
MILQIVLLLFLEKVFQNLHNIYIIDSYYYWLLLFVYLNHLTIRIETEHNYHFYMDYVIYQFVFQKEHFYFEQITYTISAYTLTSFCCSVITFFIGFLLMRYIVFTESELKGRIQFFRYALSGVLASVLNWVILKLLIEGFDIYPSISNVLSSCIVVVFSYLMQRRFSFR